MKIPELNSSENLRLIIVIIALGLMMAARKQFDVNFAEAIYPWTYSVIEGHAKDLGHIHPLFRKDAFAPPIMTWPSLSMYYSETFNITFAILNWIVVIALTTMIIRCAGFDYYSSIVFTMFVLFVGNLAARGLFDIPLLGPSPYYGFQHFSFRIPVVPLSLVSILLVLRGRLILAGVMLGLAAMIHLKYGLRVFVLLMVCMVSWNFWGCRWANAPQLKVPWRSVAGFGCIWVVMFVAMYLYILDQLKLFAGLDVPRAATSFLTRLGWAIKNEPDDYMISFNFFSGSSVFGFLFLVAMTILLCIMIYRRINDIRIKTLSVVLILSVLIAFAYFVLGFLFEKFLIDILPLSLSTNLMLGRLWDLVWVVVMAFTLVVCLLGLLWAEDLDQKFPKFPFTIRQLFLHAAFAGFVLFNLYIFFDKKDGVLFREIDLADRPNLNISYTQICNEDTALYEETLDNLWKLAGRPNEIAFYKELQVLENIFERVLKPAGIEKTNNPHVQTLNTLHNLKSNRYRLAMEELLAARGGTFPYLWSCDEKGPGIYHEHVEIPFQDFYDVNQWIMKNTPNDKGIITPPYMPKFSSYSKRVGFWDSKRDQHNMYLVEDYYTIGLHRLQAVAGPYAVLIEPGFRAGKVGLRGRAHFLSLQQGDLHRIREDYPYYDYLITENQVLSGFPKLYANASFAVYEISEKQD